MPKITTQVAFQSPCSLLRGVLRGGGWKKRDREKEGMEGRRKVGEKREEKRKGGRGAELNDCQGN